MIEILIIGMLILAVIVFALIGVLSVLARLLNGQSIFELRDSTAPKPTNADSGTSSVDTKISDSKQPLLQRDVLSTRRLVEHLKQTGAISEPEFLRIVKFLESRFELELRASPYHRNPLASTDPSSVPSPVKIADLPSMPLGSVGLEAAEIKPPQVSAALIIPATIGETAGPLRIENAEALDASIVVAEVVEKATPKKAAPRLPTTAPWDLPDPLPQAPRRSWNEMLAGFMQEKNMRWGELTSGILIVLSAVGLVVSLRDELSDAIPYFSSILFLLITAAIIGAGIYTLKKWKLRNTSRGTLVIGLLLIPLNFVAACVLSGGENRRSLDDFWLWAAVVIGFGSFGVLSWYAARFLFRKSNKSIVGCIMGGGAATVLLNRLFAERQSSLEVIAMLMPIGILFLGGATVFRNRTWSKHYWSPRGTNRQFLQLGIASFAAMSTLSILWIRSDSNWATTIAVSPLLILISMAGAFFGSIFHFNGKAKGSNNAFVGLVLQILGLILIGLFLLASIANPTVFLNNCGLVATGILILARHQRAYQLMPAAWGLLAAAALTGLNFINGKFSIDQWIQPGQLQAAFINGQSGLCLLACGAAACGMQAVIARRIVDSDQRRVVLRAGWIAGSCIFLAGCAVAVMASLIDRNNTFDSMTASLLLLTGGSGALLAALRQPETSRSGSSDLTNTRSNRTAHQSQRLLAFFSVALVLTGLLHAFIWNPTIANWLTIITTIKFANWVWAFAIHGLIFATAAAWKRPGKIETILRQCALGSSIIAVAGSISMVSAQSGNSSLVMLIVTIAQWMISWSLAKSNRDDQIQTWGAGDPFVLATAILVSIVTSELLPRFDWCPQYWEPSHWLFQTITLSCWGMAWTIISMLVHRRQRLRWLVTSNPQFNQIILFGLVAVTTILVGASLVSGCQVELFKGSVSVFSLAHEQVLVGSALAAVSLAMLLLLVEHPTPFKGAAVLLLTMLSCAAGAFLFEASNSTASAIRWLVPMGGFVAAVAIGIRRPAIPVWVKFRNSLKLQGRSIWSRQSTQQLIGFALGIVVLTVLLISTITVAQVMLNGATALGGPQADSWFGRLDKVISFGGPLALVVSTFLVYAISERRPWLATAGSLVFQYMVVLAVILLFLSPHPKLASAWFVRILQSMSVGMTLYGIIWYFLRFRIDARLIPLANGQSSEQSIFRPIGWRGWFTQIEVHTLINGLLISGLAALVQLRFYFVPDQSADWINSVGSLLGVSAWISYAVLAWTVWRTKLMQHEDVANWTSLVGWMGLVLVAILAAMIDYHDQRQNTFVPWRTFKIICAGSLAVAVCQVGIFWFFRHRGNRLSFVANHSTGGIGIAQLGSQQSFGRSSLNFAAAWPLLGTLAISLAFSVRGAWDHSAELTFFLVVLAAVVALSYGIGLLVRRTWWLFLSSGVSLIGTFLLVACSPANWFAPGQPTWINLSAIVVLTLALGSLLFYLYRRNAVHERIPRSFVALANVAVLASSIWIFLGAWVQVLLDSLAGVNNSALANSMGIVTTLLVVVLLVVSIWNDRRRFWVVGVCLTSLGIAITCVSVIAPDSDSRAVGILCGCAGIMALWGIGCLCRADWISLAKRGHAPRLTSLQWNLQRQLPICSLVLLIFLIPGSFGAILNVEPRTWRFLSAAVPLLAALGLGCLSNQRDRRWLQLGSLGLLTLGGVFVAWADLALTEIFSPFSIQLLERTLIVLASAMFIYGGLVTRWIREDDSWLKSLREMAAMTCCLAIICFLFLIAAEIGRFKDPVGCGLSMGASVSISVVVIGMIVGLISIAIRPKHDPFAFSLNGRKAYVYVAQFVAAGLIAHLYLTMPWLFQLGIKEYWPYIAMVICFSGVGVSHVLEQRNLEVLGHPIFVTAAVVPVLTATAIFVVDSKADGPLLMLSVGLAYLMISYSHGSILSGAAAILFGNFALWMFYDTNFPSLSFFDHPQLWLIPPAVSVLIAGQLTRNSLLPSQLAMLRYVCVAVIYVSSTSEIFISGLGDKLWPPLVLAGLAVVGIMAGILLQIRSFLYLGSLFLLMAMITMVAHAHQRLDHVWPWWAFGIALGIGILVMFGMFEKRKKDLKAIASQLKSWEA